MFDRDIILNWYPWEYLIFLEGAQENRIDNYEDMAVSVMWHRRAMNDKSVKSTKDLFDAESIRKGETVETREAKAKRKLARMKRAQEDLKKWKP